ncbi:Glutathione S-transferase, C-terminal-like [Parasponia andersonii]|uniref:Glutathione S-transferase, C-terminal-like n=1 Tax=Parasponia andersonii TaxID=3476 RepID=A0A2P5CUB3_PARAD|nr:Glutathione S-transferase, C-terminal-like [Parasponia andersonii]
MEYVWYCLAIVQRVKVHFGTLDWPFEILEGGDSKMHPIGWVAALNSGEKAVTGDNPVRPFSLEEREHRRKEGEKNELAVKKLYEALDKQRYICGDTLSEADIRLFVT